MHINIPILLIWRLRSTGKMKFSKSLREYLARAESNADLYGFKTFMVGRWIERRRTSNSPICGGLQVGKKTLVIEYRSGNHGVPIGINTTPPLMTKAGKAIKYVSAYFCITDLWTDTQELGILVALGMETGGGGALGNGRGPFHTPSYAFWNLNLVNVHPVHK